MSNSPIVLSSSSASSSSSDEEVFESITLFQSIENDIINKCQVAENKTVTLATLIRNKPQQAGLYLMAATKLCTAGKVHLQQMYPEQQQGENKPKEACSKENMLITLI